MHIDDSSVSILIQAVMQVRVGRDFTDYWWLNSVPSVSHLQCLPSYSTTTITKARVENRAHTSIQEAGNGIVIAHHITLGNRLRFCCGFCHKGFSCFIRWWGPWMRDTYAACQTLIILIFGIYHKQFLAFKVAHHVDLFSGMRVLFPYPCPFTWRY